MSISTILGHFRYQDKTNAFYLGNYKINLQIHQYYIEFIKEKKIQSIHISGELIYDENYYILINELKTTLETLTHQSNKHLYNYNSNVLDHSGKFYLETHLDNIKMIAQEKNHLLLEIIQYLPNPVLIIMLPEFSDRYCEQDYKNSYRYSEQEYKNSYRELGFKETFSFLY